MKRLFTISCQHAFSLCFLLVVSLTRLSAQSCSPLSTLACNSLQVSLPYSLSFDSPVAGTLADKNGAGTGFTLVLPYSGTRLSQDGAPSNPSVPGYEPSKLLLTGGRLQLTANKGIASTTANNQLNALGVKVNSQGKLQVEVSVINPYNGTSYQQAGLWLGGSDKTYVKLVTFNNKVQLYREINDVSGSSDNRLTAAIAGLDTKTLRLRLILDPSANTVQGYYSLDGGSTYTSVGTPLSTTGMALSTSTTYTGLFATYRNGTSPITYNFDNLNVTSLTPPTAGTISLIPARIYDNDVASGTAGPARTVTIRNTSQTGTLTLNTISLSGTNPDQFVLSGLPSLPRNILPQQTVSFQLAFNPSTTGLKTANLSITSNDPASPTALIPLRALGTPGTGGTNEPSLQALLDLLEIPINVGDDNSSTTVINSSTTLQKAPLLGEEVSLQQFVKADASQPVTLTPLAVFGPTQNDPVVGAGWYISGNAASQQELFTVSNSPASNGQTVNVVLNGNTSFDPGSSSFGFYSRWPFFSDRHLYSEDALNTFSGAIPHHVRVYPYKDRNGNVLPFQYLVAFEENTSGFDYQDLVFVVKNVKPKSAQSVTVTLSAVADAYVRDGSSAATNFGLDTGLYVKGTTTAGIQRATYLKFPLNSLSDIVSAKLRFYGRNTENTTVITASVLGVDTDNWTERGINWNNAPATLANALGTAAVNNQAKYYEVDVTSFVQAQFQKDKVASFALKDLTNQNRQLFFNSRENVFNQPQLVITTSAALAPTNAMLFVENLDKFPSNTDYMASRLQTPWSRDGVTFNTNHDTLRIRLWNKGSGALTLRELRLPDTANWKIVTLKGTAYNPSTQLPLTLTSGTSADVQVKFVTVDSVPRWRPIFDEMYVLSNDSKEPFKTLYLHGLWQKQGEGSKEPKAGEIISTFGFKTKVGFNLTDPDLGANNKPKGDEVLVSYFVRVDATKPVTARQMAAYHGCCDIQPEYLRWFPKGKKDSLKTVVTHVAEDAQSVLPRRNHSLTYTPSEGSFSPTTAFGFKVGTQDWSDTLLNTGRKIGIRVWKAIDARGYVIPNAYIISNDYLGTVNTNYDYNDNMYYITNIRPELGPATAAALASTPSAVDFGEQVLQGTANFALSVKNTGQTYANGLADPSVTITSVVLTGQNASEFSVSTTITALAVQQSGTVNVKFTPSSEGLKVADLLIYYNNAGSPLRVPLYGIGKALGTTVAVPYRIKSGSSTDVTVNGKTYVADTPYAFDNLEPFTNASLSQISATDEDVLYLREQSSNADKRPFRYEMPLANGTYWIRLHFAEIYWGTPGGGLSGGPGSRVMSVAVEGEPRLINLDVAGEVGSASALVKVMPVTVSDGKLNINFSATANRPMVCAVEVYQFSGGSTVNMANRLTLQPEVIDADKVRVYPNPLHRQFSIAFPQGQVGVKTIQLVDMTGRIYELGKTFVQGGGTNQVDLSGLHLSPGVYFLRLLSPGDRRPELIKLILQ